MKYLISIFIALLLGNSSFAHDHNLATFSIYKNGGVWLLKIDFTTSTMLESLNKNQISAHESNKEVKEAMIHYLKEHIVIRSDESAGVKLDKGGIKYGDHSSEVIFILKEFNEDWTTLFVDIEAFEENSKQSNLIRIQDSTGKYKAFLNSENHFEKSFKRIKIEAQNP